MQAAKKLFPTEKITKTMLKETILLEPGTLWERTVRQTQFALQCGALQSIPTEDRFIDQQGVCFIVRTLANIARKQIAKRQQEEKAKKSGKAINPFLPYDEFIENLEDWFGALTSEQERQITQWHHQWYQDWSEQRNERLQRRQKTQTEFLALLRSAPTREKLENWLQQWVQGWTHPNDPVRRLRAAQRIQERKERILRIDSILTQKQREHAIEELQGYIDQMREITSVP